MTKDSFEESDEQKMMDELNAIQQAPGFERNNYPLKSTKEVSPQAEMEQDTEASESTLLISSKVKDMVPSQLHNSDFRFIELRKKGQKYGKGRDKAVSSGKRPSKVWSQNLLNIESAVLDDQVAKVGTYGVATGHGRLVVIDMDHGDCWQIVAMLPETFMGLSGNKKLPHVYYQVDIDSPKSLNRKLPLSDDDVEKWAERVLAEGGTGILSKLKLENLLDFQGVGSYVVGPNSKLDAETVYTVFKDVPIASISYGKLIQAIEAAGVTVARQKEIIIEKAMTLSQEFKINYEKTSQVHLPGVEKPWDSELWKAMKDTVILADVYAHFHEEQVPRKGVRGKCLLGHDSDSEKDVHCDDDQFWHCHNCGVSGNPFRLLNTILGTHDEKGVSKWFANSEVFAALAGGEFPQLWKEYLEKSREEYIHQKSKEKGAWCKRVSSGDVELNKLNESYFVAFYDGKVRVMEEAHDLKNNFVLNSWSDRDFKLRYDNQRIEIQAGFDKQGAPKIKEVALGSHWLHWNCRRTYDSVVFRPQGIPEDKLSSVYNLWKGFALTEVEGDFPLIESHLRTVWCRGNEEHYQYLIAWFAHLLQKPEEKPGVALVIKGGKGTGKSTIFECIFEKILGHAYSKIDKGEQVTGKFNTHQRGKLLLVLEEAIWAGDKQAEGALKSMITDKRTLYEPKGVDAFEEDSYVRVAFVSNEKRAVPASIDERRFFSLHLSEVSQQETNYFGLLRDEIDKDGAAAFMYHLMNYDLNGVDIRNPPKTNALFEDIYESFSIFEKWVYHFLHLGWEEDEEYDKRIQWGKHVETAAFYENYKTWIEETQGMRGYLGYGEITSQTKMTQEIKKFFKFRTTKKGNLNCFMLPRGDVARKIFEEMVSAKIDWEDIEFKEDAGIVSELFDS